MDIIKEFGQWKQLISIHDAMHFYEWSQLL